MRTEKTNDKTAGRWRPADLAARESAAKRLASYETAVAF